MKDIKLGDHKARINLADPERADKLNAMRIALTYIEAQGLDVTPEQAIKIADKFMKWLQ